MALCDNHMTLSNSWPPNPQTTPILCLLHLQPLFSFLISTEGPQLILTHTPPESLPSSTTSYFCPTLQSCFQNSSSHSFIVFPFLPHHHSKALLFLNPPDFHVHAKSLQSCPTRCDPMDCSPPDPSAHGILQARILEWVAMPSSRGSTLPRD